jgi:hypothetical protein
MKKFMTLLFSSMLVFSLAMPVFAQDTGDKSADAKPKKEKKAKKAKKSKKDKDSKGDKMSGESTPK